MAQKSVCLDTESSYSSRMRYQCTKLPRTKISAQEHELQAFSRPYNKLPTKSSPAHNRELITIGESANYFLALSSLGINKHWQMATFGAWREEDSYKGSPYHRYRVYVNKTRPYIAAMGIDSGDWSLELSWFKTFGIFNWWKLQEAIVIHTQSTCSSHVGEASDESCCLRQVIIDSELNRAWKTWQYLSFGGDNQDTQSRHSRERLYRVFTRACLSNHFSELVGRGETKLQ